ncbi:hypothetical protein N0V86_005543 [Didymella sp. IMI 355093]|nr:hypothetical protein N0V86_005543 [Didymella sp. IMI 355093]
MDPIYSRQECIAAIKDFYEFLGKMYLDVSSSIIYPPDNGWPNMTTEVMGCLGKDREIIMLLRQLPYPEVRPFSDNPDAGLPDRKLYDWKTSVDKLMKEEMDAEDVLWDVEGRRHHFGKRIPKHFVGLIDAFHGENVVLLDIKTGLVYWMDCPQYILEACEPKPSNLVYPLEDVVEAGGMERATVVRTRDEAEKEVWDTETEQRDEETPPTSDDEDEDDEEEEEDASEDESDDDSDDGYDDIKWGPCWPVRHFFAMLKNHYLKLNFIPYDHLTVIHIWTKQYQNWEKIPQGVPEALQSIYHKHGWPNVGIFNKEECLIELKKEVAEKFPNIHRYRDDR